MFFRIQEEIARRNSKKPAAKKKAKTNRGRFTSKYALSERLVCGSYYRRVTWSIHGRRQIVWRCINRIENGPKACPDSLSIQEEVLHSAILKAVQPLISDRQEEISSTLCNSLITCSESENDPENPIFLQNRLDALEREFDNLLLMATDENEIIDYKLQQISGEIQKIKPKKKELEKSEKHSRVMQDKAKEVSKLLSGEDLSLMEYSDTLVYRIVERVTVLSKKQIRIRFIGGLEMTQQLQ